MSRHPCRAGTQVRLASPATAARPAGRRAAHSRWHPSATGHPAGRHARRRTGSRCAASVPLARALARAIEVLIIVWSVPGRLASSDERLSLTSVTLSMTRFDGTCLTGSLEFGRRLPVFAAGRPPRPLALTSDETANATYLSLEQDCGAKTRRTEIATWNRSES